MNKRLNARKLMNSSGFTPPFITTRNCPGVKRAGFTLAEVILAAAILAFALTGLLALFINCMLLNESSRNRSLATAHAQFVLEEIKNTNFDLIETDINAGSWNWNEAEIEGKNLPVLKSEDIETTVSASGDPLGVLVTVSWQDRLGGAKTTSLTSIFTDIF